MEPAKTFPQKKTYPLKFTSGKQLRWNRVVPRLKVKSSCMNLFEIGWMITKTNDLYVAIVNGPFALFAVEVRSYDDPMKTMAE